MADLSIKCSSLTLEFLTGDEQSSQAGRLLGSESCCVVKAVITEGLSRSYQAAITLITGQIFSDEAVTDDDGQVTQNSDEDVILGSKVRLKIEQVLTDAEGQSATAVRYLCGKISKLCFVKRVYDQGTAVGAVYELTISDPLLSLKQSFDGAAKESSVQDRLTALFNKCEMTSDLSQIKTEIALQDLQSYGMSDYVYLHRLMFLNGINYNYVHSSNSFTPKVCLSTGWTFFEEKQTELTAALDSSGSSDVLLGNFKYGRLSDPSSYKENSSYAALRSLVKSAMARDDKTINEAADCFLSNLNNTAKSFSYEIAAKAGNINLTCGTELQITDYNNLKIAVRDSSLQCETSYTLSEDQSQNPDWAEAYLAYAKGRHSSENMSEQNVQFLRLSTAQSGPGSLVDPQSAQLASLGAEFIGSLGDQSAASEPGLAGKANPSLDVTGELSSFEAVVCDENGKTDRSFKESTTNASEVPTSFYAKPLSGGEDRAVITVQALSFVGGNGHGLFALPRPGERVLILSMGSRYYLLGFLTAPDTYGTYDAASGVRIASPYSPALQGSARWMYSTDDNAAGKSYQRNYYGISFEQFESNADYVAASLYDGSLPMLVNQVQVASSDEDKAYLTAYENSKDSLETSFDNLIEERGKLASLTSSDDASTVDVLGKYALLQSGSASLADTLFDKDYKASPRLKLYAGNGNIDLISPEGGVNVKADSSSYEATDSIVLDAKKITINASKKLNLIVGDNCIKLTPSGISITSGGFLSNAKIKVDGSTGVALSGLKIKGTGVMSASLKDGLGGSIGVSKGSLKGCGYKFGFETFTQIDFAMNLVDYITNVTDNIIQANASLSGEASEMWDTLVITEGFVTTMMADGAEAFEKVGEARKEPNASNVWSSVLKIIGLITDIFETIIDYIEVYDEDVFQEYTNSKKNITRMQAIKLTLNSIEALNIATFLTTAVSTMTGNPVLEASIAGSPDGVTVKAAKKITNAQDESISLSPAAAVAVSV